MREILFRGKCTDSGEWVQGNLTSVKYNIANKNDCRFKQPDSYFIESYEISDSCQCGVCEEVTPETVGQYTGLKDKNGKKIFEGDIIKHYNYSGHPEHFCVYTVFYAEEDLTFRAREKVECGSAIYGLVNENTYEVIGNIYDNPELIGGVLNV